MSNLTDCATETFTVAQGMLLAATETFSEVVSTINTAWGWGSIVGFLVSSACLMWPIYSFVDVVTGPLRKGELRGHGRGMQDREGVSDRGGTGVGGGENKGGAEANASGGREAEGQAWGGGRKRVDLGEWAMMNSLKGRLVPKVRADGSGTGIRFVCRPYNVVTSLHPHAKFIGAQFSCVIVQYFTCSSVVTCVVFVFIYRPLFDLIINSIFGEYFAEVIMLLASIVVQVRPPPQAPPCANCFPKRFDHLSCPGACARKERVSVSHAVREVLPGGQHDQAREILEPHE